MTVIIKVKSKDLKSVRTPENRPLNIPDMIREYKTANGKFDIPASIGDTYVTRSCDLLV